MSVQLEAKQNCVCTHFTAMLTLASACAADKDADTEHPADKHRASCRAEGSG